MLVTLTYLEYMCLLNTVGIKCVGFRIDFAKPAVYVAANVAALCA